MHLYVFVDGMPDGVLGYCLSSNPPTLQYSNARQPYCMRLTGEIRQVSSLSTVEQERMLSLMTAHYENVHLEKFLTDLAEKQEVVMLYDASEVLQGFTTFLVLDVAFRNSRISALYSGDTIITQQCWGQWELFRIYGHLFQTLLQKYPAPLYWFLLTKGIKTYGLLPLFFHQFYPAYSEPTPEYEQSLLDYLATYKFNSCYLKERGIVQLSPPADRLKPSLARIPDRKRQKPHVQFFLERNPGYVNGDELVCLASISNTNFTRMARRFVKPV